MAETKGIEYLRRKLSMKRARVLQRYSFYDMKQATRDFNISVPPELSWWKSSLGWCGTAVDSLADRLQFAGFKNDNFLLTNIYQMNNPDVLYDSAILSALISSCCFIYISMDDTGYPRLQVIDGGNATGIIDPVTGLLTEGYAVIERDADTDQVLQDAYFLPKQTIYYRNGQPDLLFEHAVEYPLLVPIVYRPDATRPFGHSRISRACMDLMRSAIRTIRRSEISAEFYSVPQKWVSGLSQDAEPMDKWRATISSMLTFEKDDDGDKPTLGQFTQQSMTPHLDQVRMFASLFAGETGLTLDDLGFSTINPSSAEAIKASHEVLRMTARKAQRSFGSGFLNAGWLAACLRDEFMFARRSLYRTQPVWKPVFEPDFAAMSLVGDSVVKINQAVPGFFTEERLAEMTGMTVGE